MSSRPSSSTSPAASSAPSPRRGRGGAGATGKGVRRLSQSLLGRPGNAKRAGGRGMLVPHSPPHRLPVQFAPPPPPLPRNSPLRLSPPQQEDPLGSGLKPLIRSQHLEPLFPSSANPRSQEPYPSSICKPRSQECSHPLFPRAGLELLRSLLCLTQATCKPAAAAPAAKSRAPPPPARTGPSAARSPLLPRPLQSGIPPLLPSAPLPNPPHRHRPETPSPPSLPSQPRLRLDPYPGRWSPVILGSSPRKPPVTC